MPTWKDLKSIINAWKTELGSYVKTSTLKTELGNYVKTSTLKTELGNYSLAKDTKDILQYINDLGDNYDGLWIHLSQCVRSVNGVKPEFNYNVELSYHDLTDKPCDEVINETLLHNFSSLITTSDGRATYATFKDDIHFVKGNEYYVRYNGSDYYVIAKSDHELGSTAWQPGMGSDKDFPFYIRSDLKKIYCEGSTYVLNVTIHTVERTITPLDEKFLPHKYVQTVNSIEPDENGNVLVEVPKTLIVEVHEYNTGFEEVYESQQGYTDILNVLNNSGVCYVKLIPAGAYDSEFTCYYITEVSETSIKAYAFGSDKYLEFTSDGSINHTAS